MSNKDSTRENKEVLAGYGAGFQEEIPEEQPMGVLARVSDTMILFSLTPGPSRPYTSLKELLHLDPSIPPTFLDRVLPVGLSARMTDSSSEQQRRHCPSQLHHQCLRQWILRQRKIFHRVLVYYLIRHEETIPRPSRKIRTSIVGTSRTSMSSTLSKSRGVVKRKRMIPHPKQEVLRML